MLQWYVAVSRAKKHGCWRFPLWICFVVFILLTPGILLVEGLVCLGVTTAMTVLSIPPGIGLGVMAAILIIVACVLSQVIYFCLRKCKVTPGFCQGCGYNLTGNTSGICPECGERVSGQVDDG